MKQNKCKQCKYYKEGLDSWYIPSCWCKLGNFNNAKNCEHDKDKYTICDYFADVIPGICLLLVLVLLAFLMNL